MRLFGLLLLMSCAFSVFGQTASNALATTTAATFTPDSLTAEMRRVWDARESIIAETRKALLAQTVAEQLFALEAKSRNTTPEKVIAEVETKIVEPTPEQIQAVYDANRDSLGGRSISDVRTRIVSFLKQGERDKVMHELNDSLEKKYAVVEVKDVNAKPLRPADVLVKIGTVTITSQQFEARNKRALAAKWYEIYAQMRSDLTGTIYSTLVNADAAAGKINPSEYISREITAKVRNHTDEERESLEDTLQKKLFAKYELKFIAKEPVAAKQVISLDDDPSTGPLAAPVTVVMFTDFQCPACSRAHPVIKRVLAEYGNKVRIVIRDFPLEMHPNAFQAARAAFAANRQRKFAEYAEKLYANQDALDRSSLIKYADELGLNVKQFELDFSSERSAAEVRKDLTDGKAYGISGTPGVFVNGVSVWPFAWELRRAIDQAVLK